MNLECTKHQTPECLDWLKKQSEAGKGKRKRTRPVASGPGDERPSDQDAKGLKRGKAGGTGGKGGIIVNSKSKGGSNLPGAQSLGKGGTAEKGIIIDNGKPGTAEKGIIINNGKPGLRRQGDHPAEPGQVTVPLAATQ